MATKKALLVTHVSGFVPQFEMNHVRLLQEMGYEIHYAANYNTPSYGDDNSRLEGTGIVQHHIDFVRSPFRPENVKVFRQLCKVMRDEHFDLVHCHTPMGGVMARLAAKATHTGPVIYTAHGFHFYRGASLKSWLCYYPMERFLSRFTDQQICINKEDYALAKARFHSRYVDYIPGAGLNPETIPEQDEAAILAKKEELGLPTDSFILLSSGELIKRKNHETILRALSELKFSGALNELEKSVHYVICGHGELETYLKDLADELEIQDLVTFLGYRTDMMQIYRTADIFVFPSYQEGLPFSLLEAISCSRPVICSDIRGNSDLMGKPLRVEGELELCRGGLMVKTADDVSSYAKAIRMMLKKHQKLGAMGKANEKRSRKFYADKVTETMKTIYERLQ